MSRQLSAVCPPVRARVLEHLRGWGDCGRWGSSSATARALLRGIGRTWGWQRGTWQACADWRRPGCLHLSDLGRERGLRAWPHTLQGRWRNVLRWRHRGRHNRCGRYGLWSGIRRRNGYRLGRDDRLGRWFRRWRWLGYRDHRNERRRIGLRESKGHAPRLPAQRRHRQSHHMQHASCQQS